MWNFLFRVSVGYPHSRRRGASQGVPFQWTWGSWRWGKAAHILGGDKKELVAKLFCKIDVLSATDKSTPKGKNWTV